MTSGSQRDELAAPALTCEMHKAAVTVIGGHTEPAVVVTAGCVHEHVVTGIRVCAGCLREHERISLCCRVCELQQAHCCPLRLTPRKLAS